MHFFLHLSYFPTFEPIQLINEKFDKKFNAF